MKPLRVPSFDIVAVLVLAFVVLLSCTAVGAPETLQSIRPLPSSQPLEPVAATPDVLPTPGLAPTLDALALPARDDDSGKGCTAGDGESVYTDLQGAYCFAFPAELAVTGSDARAVSLVGPPLSQEPGARFVSMGIEVAAAPAASLAATVDSELAEYKGFTAWVIQRSETSLGGEPALRVEPVPGQLSSRVLFAQRNQQVYRLTFWPAEQDSTVPELEQLFATVSSSFRFLDAALPPPTETPGVITGSVHHGERPVAGARVQLRLTDWRTNPTAVLMETTADASGKYALVGVDAGNYEVAALWPEGVNADAPPGEGVPVTVGNGRTAVTANPTLVDVLSISAPTPGAETGARPSLAWESTDDAVSYHVEVVTGSARTSEFSVESAETALQVDAALAPGSYEVVIVALNAAGAPLAEGRVGFIVRP